MEAMAEEFADRAHSLFIYTREAHPGEIYPHHTSIEQKFQYAADFREAGLERPILVDSLDGHVHRMYGALSNMTWIVDHTGIVSFKASWTDAVDIRTALEETLRVREIRRESGRASPVPYLREISGLRRNAQAGMSSRPSHFPGGKEAADAVRRYWETHPNSGVDEPAQ